SGDKGAHLRFGNRFKIGYSRMLHPFLQFLCHTARIANHPEQQNIYTQTAKNQDHQCGREKIAQSSNGALEIRTRRRCGRRWLDRGVKIGRFHEADYLTDLAPLLAAGLAVVGAGTEAPGPGRLKGLSTGKMVGLRLLYSTASAAIAFTTLLAF